MRSLRSLLLAMSVLGARDVVAQRCAVYYRSDKPYFAFMVTAEAKFVGDTAARPRPFTEAEYAGRRRQDFDLIQFVVDTSGRADSASLKVLVSRDVTAREQLLSVLSSWRFAPARVGECAVPQLFQTAVMREQLAPTAPGIGFCFDASLKNQFSMLGGCVEFANGRGRIDVTAVWPRPAVSLNDITIGVPVAQKGDYYLFESAAFVIVRPSSRTFSVVSRATSTYRLGNVREAWDSDFPFADVRREAIAPADSLRLSQHGAFAVRWHLDRLATGGPMEVLARGRVLVADAPRGEAGLVRWMGVASALASLRDVIVPLDSMLQLTAVAVLPPEKRPGNETNIILLHPMISIRRAEIDLARLAVPADYRETPLPSGPR